MTEARWTGRGRPSRRVSRVADLDGYVIPKRRGGEDVIDNWVLACQPCNATKADAHPRWMAAKLSCLPQRVREALKL